MYTVHIFNNITLIMLYTILLFSVLHFSYGGILLTFHVVGFSLVGFCPAGFFPVFCIMLDSRFSACTVFPGRYLVGTLSGLTFTSNPCPEKQQSTENTNSNCIGLSMVYVCAICLPRVTLIG